MGCVGMPVAIIVRNGSWRRLLGDTMTEKQPVKVQLNYGYLKAARGASNGIPPDPFSLRVGTVTDGASHRSPLRPFQCCHAST